jgi:hypothetical protein
MYTGAVCGVEEELELEELFVPAVLEHPATQRTSPMPAIPAAQANFAEREIGCDKFSMKLSSV